MTAYYARFDLFLMLRDCSKVHFSSKMLARIVSNVHRYRKATYHSMQELDKEVLPSEWYRPAYAKLLKLTHELKNVEQTDGGVMHTNDGSVVKDEHIIAQMKSFKSLARTFIGLQPVRGVCFNKPNTMSSMTVNSLTEVCNLLNVSAQKRKDVRLTICAQVTQNHIWRSALEEVLHDLKHEMDTLASHCPQSFRMAEQIVSSCIKLFSDAASLSSSESPSWMKPAPLKKVDKPSPMRTWEEVLEMFVDLTKCLEAEKRLAVQVSKVEAMKEGLYQIRDIIIERDISYKEVRRQDCLVQKKLSKSLGHSSKCLFTLLLYYLYGTVQDIDVEVWGGVRVSEGRACMHMGKILPCDDEGMVLGGIKQLNKAFAVFKLVWETAAMGGVLELEGHLW